MENILSLAVDTSQRAGSVAIGVDDEIVDYREFTGMIRHSAELLPTISEMLENMDRKPADIGHIYTTIGPGSFTGLRIGITMAKMIAMATNAKIIPVSTMDALAQNANDYINDTSGQIERIATIIDAKRKQFFVATFESTPKGWEKTTNDCLITSADFIEQFANTDKPISLLGEGLVYYKEDFTAPGISFLDQKYWTVNAAAVYKTARILAKQGNFTDPNHLSPAYLRKPDAKVKQK